MDYSNYHKYRDNNIDYMDIKLPAYFTNILPSDKNSSVLDIGCGNGSVLYALKKRGYTNLQGIDLDSDAVKCCNKLGIPCVKTDI